ncbi:putative apospory-associated protein c [Phaeomoniella chlamydospora]|uniref:Glucose-6-phosphate 1-epimerase n=1 Tax=Phaeomoniella chlamydospora TaxID=158046 RepID=A0A0G2FUX9_PHACM|nr:putative apospory-associated protein c [Phaeomoniella chlamydospora]
MDRPNRPSAIPVSPAIPQPAVDITGSTVTAKLYSGESVTVHLYGATVTSWKLAGGEEQLFLSSKAKLDGSKAIRGGIPLVFPVFGPPPKHHATSALPQHGFARTSTWEFLGKSTSESFGKSDKSKSDDCVKLDFGLSSSMLDAEATKAWPYNFGLVYSVTLYKDALETNMHVQNKGSEAFEFMCLFHTYLKIKDITKTQVEGLKSKKYIDKVRSAQTFTEESATIPISSEVDRVYTSLDPTSPVTVLESGKPSFSVVREGITDCTVWNPWAEKAAGMSDFGPEGAWKNMICVEPGQVSSFTKLEAGDAWEGTQFIKKIR